MRAHLVGPAIAALLALGGLPSADALSVTRVDGTKFDPQELFVASQGCLDPGLAPPSAASVRVVRDGQAPLGQGGIGWTPTETGYVTGPMARIASPSTLSSFSMGVIRRGATLSGQALVRYMPPGETGEWRGNAAVPNADRSGWQVLNGAGLQYRWRHFNTNGSQDGTAGMATLAEFVAARGGDGDGAWVGFGFGCNGDAFDVDALSVETATESKVINFEPYKSKATLERSGGPARRATMVAGGKIKLRATLKDLRGKRVSDQARLLRAELGSKKFKPVGKVRLRKTKATTLKLAPRYNSIYKLRYPGTSSRLPSTSKTVTVKVRSNARARLSDATVIAGNAVTIKGRFGPGRQAKLALQKYVGGEWTNIKRFGSAKDGTFQTTLVNRRVGKSYWRVWVPRGGGNLPGHSATMKLVTKPKPKSKKPNPPPTKPPSNPTPPPTNNPQPPLPPPGPQ